MMSSICLSQLRFLLLSILVFGNSHLAVDCFTPTVGTFGAARASVSQRNAASVSIEREGVVISRPSTEIERRRREYDDDDEVSERSNYNDDKWEVRIYNDGLNTREHVARTLVQVTNLNEYMAYKTMMHAHHHGMATVGQYVYEIAELYHDQLQISGLVCDIIPVE